jgi:hypothetical protein
MKHGNGLKATLFRNKKIPLTFPSLSRNQNPNGRSRMQNTRSQFLNRRAFLKCVGLTCATAPAILSAASSKFRPLFNDKDLTRWHKPREKQSHGKGGLWTVNNGAIEGEQDPPGSGNGGILLSDETFGSFELKFEMRPDWGVDSGLFFRCNERGHGFQYYVDYHDGGSVGFLRGEMPGNFAMKPFQIFSTAARDEPPNGFTTKTDPRAEKWPASVYEYRCTPEEWVRAWRVDAWNTGKVRCAGKYEWNGEKSTMPGYDREKVFGLLGDSGSIGLQVHGGKGAWKNGAKCRWQNLQIKNI